MMVKYLSFTVLLALAAFVIWLTLTMRLFALFSARLEGWDLAEDIAEDIGTIQGGDSDVNALCYRHRRRVAKT